MACQPFDCIPRTIEAGTTVAFHVGEECHPSALWTAVLVFNNGVAAAVSVNLTANADGWRFDCTISATVSATLPQGATTAIPIFTKISDSTVKENGRAFTANVLPAITATATPSPAQRMLAALETAITKLSGAVNQSVSFNGQQYSKGDLAKLLQERVRLQAEVIREQETLLRARGGHPNDGRVRPEFVGPDGPFSFYLAGFPTHGYCQ